MGKIIVTGIVRESTQAKNRKQKNKRYPTCKRCGARLTDANSIKHGRGPRCLKKDLPVYVILKIENAA